MTIKPLSYEERITFGCSHAITVAYTNTTNTTLIALPIGTLVDKVLVRVSTNWNSGTSAALSVGDTAAATQFVNAVNLLAAGDEFYIAAASTSKVQTAASQFLVVTLAVVGTAATAGALTLGVNLRDVASLPLA